MSAPRLLRYGDAALLLELGRLEQVQAVYARLTAVPPAGVVDVVPAARSVLVTFDPRATDAVRVGAALEQAGALASGVRDADAPSSPGPVVEVPVRYDGPDLEEVGRLTGLGAAGVIAAHTAQLWTVAFCGFAPGFGYLVSESATLTVPRRATPRTRVPAGAVGLAGEFTGVYPRESPGGWQLLGVSDARVWDPDRAEPALLRPGVRVRFVEHP